MSHTCRSSTSKREVIRTRTRASEDQSLGLDPRMLIPRDQDRLQGVNSSFGEGSTLASTYICWSPSPEPENLGVEARMQAMILNSGSKEGSDSEEGMQLRSGKRTAPRRAVPRNLTTHSRKPSNQAPTQSSRKKEAIPSMTRTAEWLHTQLNHTRGPQQLRARYGNIDPAGRSSASFTSSLDMPSFEDYTGIESQSMTTTVSCNSDGESRPADRVTDNGYEASVDERAFSEVEINIGESEINIGESEVSETETEVPAQRASEKELAGWKVKLIQLSAFMVFGFVFWEVCQNLMHTLEDVGILGGPRDDK